MGIRNRHARRSRIAASLGLSGAQQASHRLERRLPFGKETLAAKVEQAYRYRYSQFYATTSSLSLAADSSNNDRILDPPGR